MNSHPLVSIIIPVRNVEKILGQCLESLNKLNYPKDKYEIIISDSESADKTPEITLQYNAKYISTPRRSVCAGRNAGFKIAKGEIVAFSDADCVMDNDWIKNSLKYFEDKTIGGVGGINITPKDEKPFARAVGFILNRAIFSAGSIYGRVLKKPKEVASIPGCNGIYRKSALDKVMPMDETILGGEDYAMNQKLRQFGYRILYTPDTVVWHYRRQSPKQFYKQMYRYGISRLIIGKKNRKWINLIHIIAGFGIPILLTMSIFLAYLNPLYFLSFVFLGILFLTVYFFIALFQLKSLKVAILVPYAIIILFLSWSLGFMRQLIYPIKEGE